MTASGVLDVAPVARDDVEVGMTDGLPRRLSDVDADVVAVVVVGLDVPAHLRHESPDGDLFGRAEREEVTRLLETNHVTVCDVMSSAAALGRAPT
jgi:hypothetical protein